MPIHIPGGSQTIFGALAVGVAAGYLLHPESYLQMVLSGSMAFVGVVGLGKVVAGVGRDIVCGHHDLINRRFTRP